MMAAENAAPMVCAITLWANRLANVGKVERTTWCDLFARWQRPGKAAPSKETAPGWSAATFDENRRRKDAARELCALVLDFDGTHTRDEIVERVTGLYGFLHSTASHNPAKPSFRLVLPLSRPVTPAEYAHLWPIAVRRYELTVDEQTKDPSRLWFVPQAWPGYEAEIIGG